MAIVVAHWKVGFFIFKPNQGWEYCASIAVTAFVIAMIGPGEWSLDHAVDIECRGLDRRRIVGASAVCGGAAAATGHPLPAKCGP